MSSFHTNTRTETLAPLINCVIDDALLETMPDIDQALLQFIKTSCFLSAHIFGRGFMVTLMYGDIASGHYSRGMVLTDSGRTGTGQDTQPT